MTLQIRGVHHVVLTVPDPERSARFYARILGVQPDFTTENVQCIPLKPHAYD